MHAPLEHDRREQDRRRASPARTAGCRSRPMPEPAPRAVDGAREQHRDEQQRDAAEQRPHQRFVAIGAVVDAHHDRQHRDAEQRPHHLLGDEQIRLLVALERHQRRRAVDHDDADAHERQRRQEQPLVRLKLPRHTSPALERPATESRRARFEIRRGATVDEPSAVVSRSGDWDTSLAGRGGLRSQRPAPIRACSN